MLLLSLSLLAPQPTTLISLRRQPVQLYAEAPVESPFEKVNQNAVLTGPLPLSLDNVEAVLDEMRPYLMADGGNVAVAAIDGGVVKLELQGACGTCPSSTMTMKMGLERGLREKIPEITAVEQVTPDGPQLTDDGVEEVLEEIRPFLKMVATPPNFRLPAGSHAGGFANQPQPLLKCSFS
jgi:Fe-S cluster biogenesis protein NfuA